MNYGPDILSREAQEMMAAMAAAPPPENAPFEQMRAFIEAMQEQMAAPQLERTGVTFEMADMGGVPVRVFTAPGGAKLEAGGKALLNLHGGGYMLDSGSMTENVIMAALTKLPIVAVLYRLAPEHPYPAAVDDALAVYKALLEAREAQQIGLYGTSAGACLSAQLTARLLAEGLPTPKAMGFYSGTADHARDGDSEAWTPKLPTGTVVESFAPYCVDTSRRDPLMSPIFSDLSGFPPTQVMASTRDLLMSQSALFHRALLAAGVEAELILFETLPHAFWAYMAIPETDEAFGHMARFFNRHMG